MVIEVMGLSQTVATQVRISSSSKISSAVTQTLGAKGPGPDITSTLGHVLKYKSVLTCSIQPHSV